MKQCPGCGADIHDVCNVCTMLEGRTEQGEITVKKIHLEEPAKGKLQAMAERIHKAVSDFLGEQGE